MERQKQVMQRIQAFEFNERPEVPRFVRDSIVEILGNGIRWGRVLENTGPVFMDFCSRAGCGAVLDLCSGTGEPAGTFLSAILKRSTTPPQFHLSDLFPNIEAMEQVRQRYPDRVRVVKRPVDATDVPADVDCQARTMINALHHFPPELVRKIMADCVKKDRAVFIVEGFQRKASRFFPLLPYFTASLYVSPFLARRDRSKKIFFSYVVPAIAGAGLWDAVVSLLRTHTKEELYGLVRPLGGDYEWEYREVPFFPGGRNLVFLGIPRKRKKSRLAVLDS